MKKAAFMMDQAGGIIVVVIIFVAVLVLFFPYIPQLRDIFFSQPGMELAEETCSFTGIKLKDYISILEDYNDNKAEINKDAERIADLNQKCEEFKLCFEDDFKKYKNLCKEIGGII